jgi:hypothetical protein
MGMAKSPSHMRKKSFLKASLMGPDCNRDPRRICAMALNANCKEEDQRGGSPPRLVPAAAAAATRRWIKSKNHFVSSELVFSNGRRYSQQQNS